jgi:DNA anti-recombination protein RmuC
MDSEENFRLTPLPIEKEFRVLSIRRRLGELSREELEEFLTESLSIMTKLAHQVTQLRDYIGKLEGKN